MKYTSIFFIFTLAFQLHSADKAKVLEAFELLKKTYSYKDESGNTIKAKSISFSCKSGNDCNLLINKNIVDPDLVISSSKEVLEEEESMKNAKPPSDYSEGGRLVGFTDAHNEFRRPIKVSNLEWDFTLSQYAQEWAEHLKKTNSCKMEHRKQNKFGENLAWSKGKRLNSKQVVQMWYDEIEFYDYNSNKCQPNKVCGHYTQVVWNTSKKVGCGFAVCNDEEVWVCNYDPPGNVNIHKNRPY
jgi:pathogenesis-related protein 1